MTDVKVAEVKEVKEPEVKAPTKAETIADALLAARIDMNLDSAVGVALAQVAKGDPEFAASVGEMRPKITAAISEQFKRDKLAALVKSGMEAKAEVKPEVKPAMGHAPDKK